MCALCACFTRLKLTAFCNSLGNTSHSMFRMANIVLYIQENMVNIIFVIFYLFKILNKII